jgi:hypothetical protein
LATIDFAERERGKIGPGAIPPLATIDFAERERGKIGPGATAPLATIDFAERERGKIGPGATAPLATISQQEQEPDHFGDSEAAFLSPPGLRGDGRIPVHGDVGEFPTAKTGKRLIVAAQASAENHGLPREARPEFGRSALATARASSRKMDRPGKSSARDSKKQAFPFPAKVASTAGATRPARVSVA